MGVRHLLRYGMDTQESDDGQDAHGTLRTKTTPAHHCTRTLMVRAHNSRAPASSKRTESAWQPPCNADLVKLPPCTPQPCLLLPPAAPASASSKRPFPISPRAARDTCEYTHVCRRPGQFFLAPTYTGSEMGGDGRRAVVSGAREREEQ